MALLTSIYSSSFGDGPDAKRLYTVAPTRPRGVQFYYYTAVHSGNRSLSRPSTRGPIIYYWNTEWDGGGKKRNKDIFARFIRDLCNRRRGFYCSPRITQRVV